MKTDLEPWKTNLEPWKTIKTNLNHWKPIKTEMEPWKTNLEPSKLTRSCTGWLWIVQVVTGDSQEEVMIFCYRQTDRQTLHHNIYITIVIIIVMIVIITIIIIIILDALKAIICYHHIHCCWAAYWLWPLPPSILEKKYWMESNYRKNNRLFKVKYLIYLQNIKQT